MTAGSAKNKSLPSPGAVYMNSKLSSIRPRLDAIATQMISPALKNSGVSKAARTLSPNELSDLCLVREGLRTIFDACLPTRSHHLATKLNSNTHDEVNIVVNVRDIPVTRKTKFSFI
jgi:hypothetical protein